MFFRLNPRQRQKTVDEALHAVGLALHNAQKPLARLDIFSGRGLQRFDKARQRGERRAQFMADIGDKFRLDAFDRKLHRNVENNQNDLGVFKRRNANFEIAAHLPHAGIIEIGRFAAC